MTYDFSQIKVLVVENNTAMFDLTKSVLEIFGITKIYSAYDVEGGFKTLRMQKPDLVIIDWLDEHNGGVGLTQLIRQSPDSPNPFVPIIMMTGYSQKRRVLMARDSGITEFIVKPFTANALYQKIEAIIENPRQFVKSEGFFGPDRRRKRADYDGVDRRQDVPISSSKAKPKKGATPSQKAREIQNRKTPKDEN